MELIKSKLPSFKNVFMGASFILFSRIFSSFLGYVNLILIANILNIEQFGLYSFIISLLTIAYIVSNFGIENTLIYLIPQKRGKSNSEYLNLLKVIRTLLIFSSAIVILLILWLEEIIFINFNEEYSRILLYLLLICIPIQSFVVYFRVLNQTNYKYVQSSLPENIVRPTLFFILLLILSLYQISDINLILMAYLSSYLIALVIGFFLNYFIKERKNKIKLSKKIIDFEIIKDCYKFVNIQLLNQLAPFIIVYLLGIYQTTASIGLFRAAFQTATLIAFALRAIESVYTPIFSTLYNDKRKDELKSTFQNVTNWMITIGGLICLVSIVFSNEIMAIFGDEFRGIVFVFQLLCINQLANTIFGSVDYILIVSGRSKVVFYLSLIQALLVIISGSFLIAKFGLIGAAIAIILGTLTFKGILTLLCYKYEGIQPYNIRSVVNILLLIINYIVMLLIINLESLSIKILLFIIVLFICFFLPFYLFVLAKNEKNKIKFYCGKIFNHYNKK